MYHAWGTWERVLSITQMWKVSVLPHGLSCHMVCLATMKGAREERLEERVGGAGRGGEGGELSRKSSISLIRP